MCVDSWMCLYTYFMITYYLLTFLKIKIDPLAYTLYQNNSKLIIIFYIDTYNKVKGFPCGSAGKESSCNAGAVGLIPGLGRFPG